MQQPDWAASQVLKLSIVPGRPRGTHLTQHGLHLLQSLLIHGDRHSQHDGLAQCCLRISAEAGLARLVLHILMVQLRAALQHKHRYGASRSCRSLTQ